ncbi:hypothetical protein TorRG33x02_035900 [Trema orientale]|uniref:Uncharacterized protein n=1 Tax=Trema orientale TaxID=63057 RepID=A0A2P5FRT7_TREOI|nr:hypothetical protein TorRG33x02_035900 [Trema orientale]
MATPVDLVWELQKGIIWHTLSNLTRSGLAGFAVVISRLRAW